MRSQENAGKPARPDERTQVIIVGAGPAGLTLSLLLARQGIQSVVLERRDGIHKDPQAHVVATRTMEIFREMGIEPAMRDVATDPMRLRNIVWCTTLAGMEIGRIAFDIETEAAKRLAVSPTVMANIAQPLVEGTLLARALEAQEVSVRMRHEFIGASETGDGVIARVREVSTGREFDMAGDYLVGCDGAGSTVRRVLGTEMTGPKLIQSFIGIHFECDLSPYIENRLGPVYWILNRNVMGALIGYDVRKTWVLMVPYFMPGQSPADFTPEICATLIREAVGIPDIEPVVKSINPWMMSSQVADNYGRGRIYLAGDAAHRFPPTGGLGLNTGMGDVQNLAWKLAGVLQGWLTPAALATYESERRPIARINADQSLKNEQKMIEVDRAIGLDRTKGKQLGKLMNFPFLRILSARRKRALVKRLTGAVAGKLDLLKAETPDGVARRASVQHAIDGQIEHFSMLGLDIGHQYTDGLVVSDGTMPPMPENHVTDYIPSTTPGRRLPHAWLDVQGEFKSTLDVAGCGRFTLIVQSEGKAWANAAREVAAALAAPLDVLMIDGEKVKDMQGAWAKLSGVGRDGAVLVRPDGYVGWREQSLAADPSAALRHAMKVLTGRPAALAEIGTAAD